MPGTWSKCSRCGEEFGGVSPFDAHLKIDYDNKDIKKFVTCLSPAEIGLERNEYGHWGGVARAVSVRQTHNQVLDCAKCGTIWERPPQKGRLPKFCPKCKEK